MDRVARIISLLATVLFGSFELRGLRVLLEAALNRYGRLQTGYRSRLLNTNLDWSNSSYGRFLWEIL